MLISVALTLLPIKSIRCSIYCLNLVIFSPYLGCTTLLQHTIDTSSASPILQRSRRLPIHIQADIQVMIEDMVRCGIIQPSRSPWCAPIVVVTKKNGSKRLCVDFRKLNGVTTRDSYPLPRIEDVLNVLARCCNFSALDMKSGITKLKWPLLIVLKLHFL